MGLRDADVSKATGISTATLSEWKKGRYQPKLDKLEKIAKFLNVNIEAITQGTTPEQLAGAIVHSKEMKLLIEAAKGSASKDLLLAAEMLNRMKSPKPE
jgi:transcriptional regulator with XRE-family HTH domain